MRMGQFDGPYDPRQRCQCALVVPPPVVSPAQLPMATLRGLMAGAHAPEWQVREWVAWTMARGDVGDFSGGGRHELQDLVGAYQFGTERDVQPGGSSGADLLFMWERIRDALINDTHHLVSDMATVIPGFDLDTGLAVADPRARRRIVDARQSAADVALPVGVRASEIAQLGFLYRDRWGPKLQPYALLADPICALRSTAVLGVDPTKVGLDVVSSLRRDPCEWVRWRAHPVFTVDPDLIPDMWANPETGDQIRAGEPPSAGPRWTADVPGDGVWVRLPDHVGAPYSRGQHVVARMDGSRWVRDRLIVPLMAFYGPPRPCRYCANPGALESTLWQDNYDPDSLSLPSYELTCTDCPGRTRPHFDLAVAVWDGNVWCRSGGGGPIAGPAYLEGLATEVVNVLPSLRDLE